MSHCGLECTTITSAGICGKILFVDVDHVDFLFCNGTKQRDDLVKGAPETHGYTARLFRQVIMMQF